MVIISRTSEMVTILYCFAGEHQTYFKREQ